MENQTNCCPRFDPAPWDGKEVTWQDKLFVKDHVTSLFHIPLNFGSVVTKNMTAIEANGAKNPENLMLSDEKSLWGSDVFFAVDKEIPGAALEKISGTFLAKVFEGPFKDAGKWAKEMVTYVASKGKKLDQLYFWYTTCPKCAKVYGKNYVVLLAKV